MFSHKRQIAAIVLALVWLAACSSAGAVPAPTNSPTAVAATAAPTLTTAPTTIPATATPAALTLTDSVGRKVTLAAVPQRIVSLAPSTTEILFALGVGKRVVAVDQFSDYPAEAKQLPKVTQGFTYNYEQIVAARPDLVFAAGITSPDVIKKLEDLKLNVIVVGAPKTTYKSVMEDIRLAGQAVGAEAEAQRVTNQMEQKLSQLKSRIAQAKTHPRVYWELDASDPAKPYAPGPGSFIDDLIKLAGGENVTASAKQAYTQVNAEEIVRAAPDIIILSDAAYGITPASVKARPGWDVIPAVVNDKVFPIDDNLVSRPGPRIVDGLEAAARLIHPELF